MAEKDLNKVDDRRLSYRLLSDVLKETSTPLNDGETYTSMHIQSEGFEYVVLTFYADQDAIIHVQYSQTGSQWDAEETYDYTGGNKLGLEVKVMAPLAQIKIENDSGADMTTMRMHARGRV